MSFPAECQDLLLKTKSSTTTTSTQKEPQVQPFHSTTCESPEQGVNPPQVQLMGLKRKKVRSLSSRALGLQRAQAEQGVHPRAAGTRGGSTTLTVVRLEQNLEGGTQVS